MRTLRLRPVPAVLGACIPLLAAGGCKWTDFDDLAGDTWVTAVEKPDNPAANWGIAIARVTRSGSGGKLAVLGATSATYNDLIVDPNGGHTIPRALELNAQFLIGNVALEPLFLTSPDADEVALVTALEAPPLDAPRILVIRAFDGQFTSIPVTGPAQPSAATYMVTPPRAGDSGPQTQILVAQNGDVFGAYFDPTKAPVPPAPTKCTLQDETTLPIPPPLPPPINIRALAAYRPPGAMSDDVLVLSESGKLMAYPGSVFHSCMGTVAPKPGFVRDLMFPGVQTASQILVFADATASYALVQMHADGGRGRLGLYRIDADSIDEIGTARDIDRLRTASLFEPGDGKRYVLAGMPTASVDGVTAGMVQVIEVGTTTGIADAPAMTLADAQPEDTQVFGRSVAALPYNGKSIIAVAADNEIFLYFRTALYDETREGR
jgi:hypothetical protein